MAWEGKSHIGNSSPVAGQKSRCKWSFAVVASRETAKAWKHNGRMRTNFGAQIARLRPFPGSDNAAPYTFLNERSAVRLLWPTASR